MKSKKIIAALMSLIMIVSFSMPIIALADENKPTITIKSVAATPGETVDIEVTIANNPGILGAKLTLTYDSKLTLQNVTNGSAFSALTMTKPSSLTSPCNIIWDGQDLDKDDIKDGTVLLLRFIIPNDATESEIYNISASYEERGFVDTNLEPVDITITNGKISVDNIKYGDLDGDGKVNTADVIMMRRHIAGGYLQTINERAADVNLDTNINTTDVILVRRFIAGGYGVELPYRVCKHTLEAVPEKAATETENGNIAYWHCKSCGKYFCDANGTKEISLADTIIPIIDKDEYSIQYACDMVPQAADTYRPSEGKVLPKPALDKYTFVGWTDKDGNLWNEIPVGTKGNITLYANWASNRNKAVAKETLDAPLILEDIDNGLILFTYEIGEIQNVPLFTTLKLNCVNGIISTTEVTHINEISDTQAASIAQSISNATTNSSSWTLSSDWNEITEVSESYLQETGRTREESETIAKSENNTYFLNSSSGGSSDTITVDGNTYKQSGNSNGSNSQETGIKETTSLEANVGGSIGFGLGSGSGTTNTKGKTSSSNSSSSSINMGITAEISGEKSREVSGKNTGTWGWSDSEENGTNQSTTKTDSSTWNTTSGYENSKSTSQSSTISNIISEVVSQQKKYGKTYSAGGSNSESQAFVSANTRNDEYSSTMTYYNSKITSTTTSFSSTGHTDGDYRMVIAGTVHVFAVVGYDIANREYFVYTYNILGDGTQGDGTYEYLDYSHDGTFKDYETSVIPFEVPFFVNEYVTNQIARTNGLLFDADTGMIVDYIPEEDTNANVVVIPSYIAVSNNDGTYSAKKVTGIAPELFKNNQTIKAVQLGRFITEIPDSTFEGCTSLEYILCPGVDKIGDNAFKHCTSLHTFNLPEEMESLGDNAFEGVSSINAKVSKPTVAKAVASCGADNIILDISSIPDDETNSMELNIGNISTFELQGKDKEYKGLSVKSDAETTIINGVTFTENSKIPMELSSENVTLDRVTVDCTGFALVLKEDNTNLVLNRTVNLISENENTVLCKNINLSNMNNSIVGKLNVTGNILVCGEVNNSRYLTFTNGEIIYISSEEYTNYLSSHKINFDANGGTMVIDSKIASLNMAIGELPIPSKDYYTFEGWYTEMDGGERVTADTIMTSLKDMTLYAHWVDNDVSPWVLKSAMPDDAQIVDTKYGYTLTSYTTASSSSLNGWEKYDTQFVWGAWSGWSRNWVGSSDSRQVNTRVIPATYQTRWTYCRWVNNAGSLSSYSGVYPNFQNIDLDYRLSYKGTVDGNARYGSYDGGYGNYLADWWWHEGSYQSKTSDEYTEYQYRDKIFTYYYKKSEEKESKDYPTGENISNIQEYVQYRMK